MVDFQMIKVMKLHPSAILPQKGSRYASGYDLFAFIDGGVIVLEKHPQLIGTGIAMEIPQGYDVQVRPRSGLSLKGVGVAFGTIDSDYRGEIKVTMFLYGNNTTHEIRTGDRIAQLVISRVADIELVEADALSASERGDGGHGSTGMR